MMSLFVFMLMSTELMTLNSNIYIEDITWWREDMKFIFEWKKYFTSECSERVKSFFHKKINFICSN